MKLPTFLDQLSPRVRLLRPLLLLSLLVIGALAGLAIRELFLTKYQARISLSMSGDLTTFREAEPLFSSPEAFEKYGAKQKLSGTPEFEQIHRQLVRNLSAPVKIDHAFRLSRKDVRDLPDMYARDELSRQIGTQGLQSDLQVYATARQPEAAIRLAKVAMGYARDCLTSVSLRLSLRRWGPGARNELASNRESIARLRSELASADRRIESMERLKDKYKDEKEKDLAAASGPPVQFQLSGTRNLSPFQQIIGLETDRAETIEKLRLAEEDRLRLQTMIQFAELLEPRIDDGDSINVTKQILNQARRASRGEEADPAENARSNIAAQMQGILSRFEEAKTEPIEPEARSVGIGRAVALLFGLVFGGALWLLLLLTFPVPRSKPDVAI
jgi:hypothetical protein